MNGPTGTAFAFRPPAVPTQGHAGTATGARRPDQTAGRAWSASARVIVDTNILVGGLLMSAARAPEGARTAVRSTEVCLMSDRADPLARIVAGMRDGTVLVATSAALTAEYRDVWSRPTLARRRGWSSEALDAVLEGLAAHAAVLAPPPGPRAPDPGDQMLWDLLAAEPGLRLVTADRALLRDRGMIGRVVTATAHAADIFAEPSAGRFP